MTSTQHTLAAQSAAIQSAPRRVEGALGWDDMLTNADALALVRLLAAMVAEGDELGAAWELLRIADDASAKGNREGYERGHAEGYLAAETDAEGLDNVTVAAFDGPGRAKVRIDATDPIALTCTAYDTATGQRGTLTVSGTLAKWEPAKP